MSSNHYNDINPACGDSGRRSSNIGVVLFSVLSVFSQKSKRSLCTSFFFATTVTAPELPAYCFSLASVTSIALLDGGGIDFDAIVFLHEKSMSRKLTKLTDDKHCRDLRIVRSRNHAQQTSALQRQLEANTREGER